MSLESNKFNRAKQGYNKMLLLGVGNILLGDEGLGVHAVNRLREQGLPEKVEAVDGGTLGLGLLNLLKDVTKLVVVDCVDAGAEPGTVFRFRPEELRIKGKSELSFHQLGLMEVLSLAEGAGDLPETVIIGMQPKNIDEWKLELSSVIEKNLPILMEKVMREIQS